MQRPRTPSNLSESLHQRLNSYALAASAAGVGVLAFTQPANAEIIYVPAHVVITPANSYPLRFNRKKTNFSLAGYSQVFKSGSFERIECLPLAKSDRILGSQSYADALPKGDKVGASGAFSTLNFRMAAELNTTNTLNFRGPWANDGKGVKNRYLGLTFMIDGKTHYGWARLNVHINPENFPPITATLTGYAYETVPNKPIIAGKTHGKDVVTVHPASPGHLARGASAISAWRRSEQ